MSLPRALLLPVLLLASLLAAATCLASPLVFADPAQEARFHALTAQLRCVQCQNQSLADSDALIAQDMRRQVLSLIQQGHSDAQIRDYLVQRYGQFVLYRPALSMGTLALWFGPLLLLLCGALVGWRIVRRRQQQLPGQLPPGGNGANW